MISAPIVGLKKKTGISRKGIVEEVNKFNSTPLPPASGGHFGFNTNKGLIVIIDY